MQDVFFFRVPFCHIPKPLETAGFVGRGRRGVTHLNMVLLFKNKSLLTTLPDASTASNHGQFKSKNKKACLPDAFRVSRERENTQKNTSHDASRAVAKPINSHYAVM